MKKLTFILFLITCVSLVSSAQDDLSVNTEKRRQFFKELRDYKHNYLAKELSLSKDQQQKFFPVYDEMEDNVAEMNEETRLLEKKVSDNMEDATDLELDKATEALYELKIKEGETEKDYAEKFKSILSKKQLFQLKNAERNFNRELLQHQSRLRRRAKN